MLFIASDHAGYQLKQGLKEYLKELGVEFEDLGNESLDPQDDYPDFAKLVAQKVAGTDNKGILICGTGQGMCLFANKIPGIRAVLAHNEYTAQTAAEHLNANILCLGGRVLDIEQAKKIVKTWLQAKFSGEERHRKRLGKVEELETSGNI